jgi:hypothetical protein
MAGFLRKGDADEKNVQGTIGPALALAQANG